MFLHGLFKSGRHRYIISATLSYAVFALLWIFLSDQLLAVFSNIREIVWLSTAKGIGFVLVSTLLLFFALRFVPSGEQRHFSLDSIVIERETPLRWPRWMAYAFAATITLVALWIRQSLQVSVELRSLMTIFMFPIILSAALGGVGPGLLATAIAAIFVNFFVIQPVRSLLIANPYDHLQLGFLVANGVLISFLSEIMHRALRRIESVQQLQAVTLACAGDAIVTTDKHGNITLLNAVAERLTGWSRQQAAGQPLTRIIKLFDTTELGLKPAEDPLHQVLASGAPVKFDQETLLRNANGTEYFISMTGAPILVDDGTTLGMILTFRDDTERKLAEKALREKERRYARVIEGSDQGFWEWNLKTNQFDVSPRFESMLGYAIGERTLTVEEWPRIVHPEDMPKAWASIDNHLKGRAALHEVEFRTRTKSGEWKWILTRGKIVEYDTDGTPLLMAGTHTDISERKHAEAALRQAATVFESTREGVLITDANSRIVMVNRAFNLLTGYSEAEVKGKSPSLLNSGRNSKERYAAMWEEINATGYWQGELWNRRKNGEIFPVLISINAIKDESGAVTNYVSVFMDISTLKASEEQLDFLAHHV